MRSYLFASTALVAIACPAAAQTLVDTARTDQVRSSTIKSGGPDAIRITSAGSIKPTSGTAVTIDSSNAVTNEGTIQIINADGATGILANAGTGGGMTNGGTITIGESYAPADADKDGDLDGPFAIGKTRSGIRTAGAYTGNVVNSANGVITVKGNDSTGISLGGPLTGNLTHDGKTTVIGDRATGISAGSVSGNVRLAGSISAQGNISATGYRHPTAPTDATKLDVDDFLLGGSALVVEGNVTGGIVLAVPPKNNSASDADEDKDGIDDAKEGSAAVASYGSAPAMVIGSTTQAVTIGPVAGTGTGFGLIMDGTVLGSGVYSGVDGNALVIGGRGAPVTIAGGMGVSGKVEAISVGAAATAIHIGGQASVPEIRNSGSILATSTGGVNSKANGVVIDVGASVPTIRNSGTIKATTSNPDGTAIAIGDKSGTVSLIENSGIISASGATATSDRNVAIDLSANTLGATIRQTAVAAGVAEPSIVGDIRFGSGNDVLEIADGSVKGNVGFGAGNNRFTMSGDGLYTGNVTFGAGSDSVSLAGTSSFSGAVDFGGGTDRLGITGGAKFLGALTNSAGLAVNVGNGSFGITKAASIGSLVVGDKGVLSVLLDKSAAGGTTLNVAGEASFLKGSSLALRLASFTDAEGRYVVLRAGGLTGAADLTANAALLPFLYKGTLATGAPNELLVDVKRKTVGELGLNKSQASAFDAIYKALGNDKKVGDAFAAIRDGDGFRQSIGSLLPDHAGGTFETTTLGSRAIARLLSDPHGPFKDEGSWGYWISSNVWGTQKNREETAGYDAGGWSAAAGLERKTGVGNFGLSAAYLWNQANDRDNANEVLGDQYELAAYWRGRWGGLTANARGSWATIDFSSQRRFDGSIDSEKVERVTSGDWRGTLKSVSAGVAYETGGKSFFIRPGAAIDYYSLKENGYTETGGGKSLNLTVSSRTSDELAATGTLAAGVDFMGFHSVDQTWFRVEAEGGRREILNGSLGLTRAHYDGGTDFTLTPESRTSGWNGKVRATGGNSYFRLGAEAGAEQQQGRWALSLRTTLQIGL